MSKNNNILRQSILVWIILKKSLYVHIFLNNNTSRKRSLNIQLSRSGQYFGITLKIHFLPISLNILYKHFKENEVVLRSLRKNPFQLLSPKILKFQDRILFLRSLRKNRFWSKSLFVFWSYLRIYQHYEGKHIILGSLSNIVFSRYPIDLTTFKD